MKHALFNCPVILAILMSVASLSAAQADDAVAKSFHDRVSDMATLADGTKLLGIATSRQPATLLLRTSWIQTEHPDFLKDSIQPLLAALPDADAGSLPKLLDAEIARLETIVPKDQQRIAFLKEIAFDLTPEPGQLPEFLLVEIPKERLRRLDVQPEARRDLGQLAVLNRIENYENLKVATIKERLAQLPPDSILTQVPASADVATSLQTLLAAIDVQLGTATRLIRTGDSVVDESAPPNPAQLLQDMLGSSLQQTLGDLLTEGGAGSAQAAAGAMLPSTATRIADKAGRTSLVLSSFQFDLPNGTAQVTRQLFTKSRDGEWMPKPVVESTVIATIGDVPADAAAAIANDPQVQQITSALDGLGIGDEQLQTALSMGAVVQLALKKAEAQFQEAILRTIKPHNGPATTQPPLVRLPR